MLEWETLRYETIQFMRDICRCCAVVQCKNEMRERKIQVIDSK